MIPCGSNHKWKARNRFACNREGCNVFPDLGIAESPFNFRDFSFFFFVIFSIFNEQFLKSLAIGFLRYWRFGNPKCRGSDGKGVVNVQPSLPPRLVSIYSPLLIFKFYPLLLSQLLQTIFFFPLSSFHNKLH